MMKHGIVRNWPNLLWKWNVVIPKSPNVDFCTLRCWVMSILRHHVWMCFECWNMLKHILQHLGTWCEKGQGGEKNFFLTTMTAKEEDLKLRSPIERCVLEAIEHAGGHRFWLSMFLLVLDILGGISLLRQAYTWLDFLPVYLRRVEVVKSPKAWCSLLMTTSATLFCMMLHLCCWLWNFAWWLSSTLTIAIGHDRHVVHSLHGDILKFWGETLGVVIENLLVGCTHTMPTAIYRNEAEAKHTLCISGCIGERHARLTFVLRRTCVPEFGLLSHLRCLRSGYTSRRGAAAST